MQNTRSGQAKAVLTEVQTRHDDIKRIQKTILELAQLFEDMQMMVEQQGETLDVIEQNAEDTQKDIEQGDKHINRAIVLARSTRAVSFLDLFMSGIPVCAKTILTDRKNGVVSLLLSFSVLSLLFLFGGSHLVTL